MTAKKKIYNLQLKALRRQETANYISRAENKPKALWGVINKERNRRTDEETSKYQLNINVVLTSDPTKLANHFNDYFTTTAETTLRQNGKLGTRGALSMAETETTSLLIRLKPSTPEEVRKVIRQLKPKTSYGMDEVSAKLVKHCADELTAPLVEIINISFTHGKFPSALKLAKTYPKHKKGSSADVSNYRPISLIPTFSKVIEKIALARLMDHLEGSRLLTDKQHGFLKNKSTTTAITSLVEFLTDSLEEGNFTSGILLDLSKAFDCLDHKLTIGKLKTLGIQGTALRWFKSYLEDRMQVVELKHVANGVIQEVRSKPLPITRGVPQGSVLGPVIFILYTNNFPESLREHCDTLMYADDTTLLVSRQSAPELQIDTYIALNVAYQFCHENDLATNMTKSKQLVFGRRGKEVLDLPDLDREPQANFLGVTIDDKLSWTPHVNRLCKKLNSGIFVVRRIKTISDMQTAKTAYYALIETHIRYGLIAWGGTSKENLDRVLGYQKRAVRAIATLRFQESCREHFKSLKIMTVVSLYIREVILHVVQEELPRGKDTHTYNTRHASLFTLPVHHLSLTERKPTYTGRKMYNHLPEHLRRQKGAAFKKNLSKWLMEKTFYTLNEFYDCPD